MALTGSYTRKLTRNEEALELHILRLDREIEALRRQVEFERARADAYFQRLCEIGALEPAKPYLIGDPSE